MAWSLFLQVVLATALALFFAIAYLVNRKRGELPMNWPVIGILPAIITNFDQIHDYTTTILRAAKGTIVFSGPGSLGAEFIFTCDPANANHVLNLHSRDYPKGDNFFEIFDVLGDGIFNVDGDAWKLQRNMALSVLKDRLFMSSVESNSRSKVEKALIPLLNGFVESGKAFDLQDVFLRFTFDATCSLVLGVDLGSLAPDFPTIPFAKATDDCEHVLLLRHLVPKFWWKLLRRLNVGEEKKYRMGWEEIDRFLGRRIKEARADNNKNNSTYTISNQGHADVLRAFMNHPVKEGEGHDIDIRSDKFLRDSMINLMSAGKDTTGVALSWLFWLVAKNPDVEAKILQELRESSINTFNSEGESIASPAKWLYLHASLCETLRLYPSVPFNHKHSRIADVLPSGQKISKGAEILINMYSMGRMETVWGKDSSEFRPERWITEEGKLRHEPSYKFIAFNSGPRTCIGKDISLCQMKIVAAVVISNFKIHLVEGHVVKPKLSVVLHMKNGVMVRVTKRQ